MADWYVSSVAYAAIPVWLPSTAYTVGQFVRPTTATYQSAYAYRCTTAGTSGATEPSWSAGNNGTTASGTATFTNVSGQSAYGWSAAAGTCPTIFHPSSFVSRVAGGDRVFVRADHTETVNSAFFLGSGIPGGQAVSLNTISMICVKTTSAVPPVAADVTTGAQVTCTSLLTFQCKCPAYIEGVTFTLSGGGGAGFNFNDTSTGFTSIHFKNCLFSLGINSTPISHRGCSVTFDNVSMVFGAANQSYGVADACALNWINTPNALSGTPPTTLFVSSGATASFNAVLRGVDISNLTGTLIAEAVHGNFNVLLDSCKINPALTRYNFTTTIAASTGVELVNCYDGTKFVSERHQIGGSVVTDLGTTLAGGAADDVGAYALKMVSNANVGGLASRLASFLIDVENADVGAARTASVEIVSSTTLKTDDIGLLLEYQGTAGSSLASFGSSLPTPLTSVALPTSSATWNNPPATPVKQLLQVPFTPRTVGRVRGLVRLGKPSATVWVNPMIAIT